MARKKVTQIVDDQMDGVSAAGAETGDAAGHVFDGPFNAQQAVDALCELNHERVRCAREWEEVKLEAANAKKALDDATNAITLLIDRIDAEQKGELSGQPALKTLNFPGAAETTV